MQRREAKKSGKESCKMRLIILTGDWSSDMEVIAMRREFTFPEHVLESVTVFKVDVTEFTGKRLVKK